MLARNSPGLANAAYNSTLTWANNGLIALEDQLEVPIRGDRPVELLLMRQLASYLKAAIYLVGPDGTLLFYNEPAERLLGLRFEESEPMSADAWSEMLETTDTSGAPIPPEERPMVIAWRRQQPAHRRFWIRSFDGVPHDIEGLAFPLVGDEGRQLGAVGIFWEHRSLDLAGSEHAGA